MTTIVDDVTVFDAAVIFVEPGPMALIVPLESTAATLRLLLIHSQSVAPSGKTVADACAVDIRLFIVTLGEDVMVIAVTGARAGIAGIGA